MILYMNWKVQNASNRSIFRKTDFCKQVFDFHFTSKILCQRSRRQNHWSLLCIFLCFISQFSLQTLIIICYFFIHSLEKSNMVFTSAWSKPDFIKIFAKMWPRGGLCWLSSFFFFAGPEEAGYTDQVRGQETDHQAGESQQSGTVSSY
jgi:hypothetical protein